MNMKKTIYTVIATLLFLISSCTLEQEVYNKINPGMFPQNAEDVNALVNSSAYYVFSPWGIFEVAAGYVTTSEMVTDYVENTWGWTTVYNSYEANDWHIDGDYRRVYDYSQYLASMTLTMERIKNVDMDETLKARYMAELKCGRGFLAFLMYDMYGPIPIADLETLQKPEAEIVIPRLSEEAMREYIVTNLKEAADILPYKYEDTDYGRFTKGLANTLLLKFYMMTKQWDEAEKIGRELTKSEYGYKLVDDYHSLFSLSGEKNSEVIFSCVAEAGVMEQKWFAHVLTSDYPIPAGMAVTAWGGYKISWPAYESFDPKDKRRERIIGEYTGTEGVHHTAAPLRFCPLRFCPLQPRQFRTPSVTVLSTSVPSASHPASYVSVRFAPLVEGVGDAVGNVLQGACFRRFRLFGAGGSICSPPRASWRCARYGVRLRTRRRNRRRAS